MENPNYKNESTERKYLNIKQKNQSLIQKKMVF